jgi:dienelactone hydrolase
MQRIIGEIRETHTRFDREGLLEKPENYHRQPPDLIDPEIRQAEARGHRVELLRFESGYAPLEGEAGRERWLGYESCREGWAYVLRHPGPPRPWLICTNGYRMGFMGIDVRLFERFFVANGLNVLIPVLPLHGPRRRNWHSGTGFLGVDVIDTIHAEAQSIWDMRRLLSWVRAQDAPAVGAFGLSLGGYTTALFASIAEGLSCAIPGIPLTDIPRMVLRHGDPHQIRYAQHLGYDIDLIEDLVRVVSPLVLEPKVDKPGRLIFGANADRLVTPDQVADLWKHWERPEIVWYAGSHISFMGEREVWTAVDRKLRDTGVAI